MTTLQLHSKTTPSVLEQINASIRGSIVQIDDEYILKLDNEIGIGSIHYTELRNGITYLAYDMLFHENFQIAHESKQNCPVFFTYAREAEVEHSFGAHGSKQKLGRFQTGIFRACRVDSNSVFHFSKGDSYKMTMMIVSTKCGEIENEGNSWLFSKIGQLFKSQNINKNFAYLGSYNLKISEKIKQLNAISYDGIVRTLMKEALVNTILALEIQQHADDLKNKSQQIGSLSKKEMEMIKDLSEFIQNYPDREYTIKSLCARSGLSSAKLQEGFRLMYGMTVTHYIRHIRILVAEHLIKTTDLNISEIVYSIGLTSRSYFSKIFKKKYGCSPKSYQENQRISAIAI